MIYIVAYRLINLLIDSEYSSTDAHIAESLLGMIDELEYLPIDQVAERCHISKSTLSKFVKYLGFDDYREFRENARNEKKKAGYHNYEQMITMDQFIESHGMEQYLKVLSNDIGNFLNGVDMPQIQKLAEALCKYDKVAAFGAVYSETVALDFSYKLAAEKKYVKTYIYDKKQECYFRDADEETLVIIFSNSGQYIYQDGMKLSYEQPRVFVRKSKAKLALVTSNKEAALDPIISYPVLYHFTTALQNHPIAERLIAEMIINEYKRLIKSNL